MAGTDEREFFGGSMSAHPASRRPRSRIRRGLTEELKRHGYSISPGTLYPILHQLEHNGYLALASAETSRGYVATAAGKLALQLSRPRIQALVRELFGKAAQG